MVFYLRLTIFDFRLNLRFLIYDFKEKYPGIVHVKNYIIQKTIDNRQSKIKSKIINRKS